MPPHNLATVQENAMFRPGKYWDILQLCTSGRSATQVRTVSVEPCTSTTTARQKADLESRHSEMLTPRTKIMLPVGLEEVVASELMKAPIGAIDVNFVANKAGVDFRFVTT